MDKILGLKDKADIEDAVKKALNAPPGTAAAAQAQK